MGCDIHAYIEYYKTNDSDNWVDVFSDGEISLGRNYLLFGCMAGVRHLSVTPVAANRGLPTNPELSWWVNRKYHLRVVEDQYKNDFDENIITRSELEQLSTQSLLSFDYRKEVFTKDNVEFIKNPDYHSTTWLNLHEMMKVRKLYLMEQIEYWSELSNKKRKELIKFISDTSEFELMKYTFPEYDSPTLYSTIATMNALEHVNNDIKTRLFCWFDS